MLPLEFHRVACLVLFSFLYSLMIFLIVYMDQQHVSSLMTVVYRQISSEEDCVGLQNDLDSLQEWEKEWLMEFHPSKCQLLRVTNKKKPVVGQYKIHDHILEEVDSAKYLGVHIDSRLNFNTHVDAITKKANSINAFLRRNFNHCSRKVKQATYTTYVRPVLEYAAAAWDPHTRRNIDKLEMVQRRGARYVTGDYGQTSSVSAMLDYLQWPTLERRRTHIRLSMLYHIARPMFWSSG